MLATSVPPRSAARATRRGSPPNTPMWVCTQVRAATWSSSPQLPLSSPDPAGRGRQPVTLCDSATRNVIGPKPSRAGAWRLLPAAQAETLVTIAVRPGGRAGAPGSRPPSLGSRLRLCQPGAPGRVTSAPANPSRARAFGARPRAGESKMLTEITVHETISLRPPRRGRGTYGKSLSSVWKCSMPRSRPCLCSALLDHGSAGSCPNSVRLFTEGGSDLGRGLVGVRRGKRTQAKRFQRPSRRPGSPAGSLRSV